MTSRVVPAVHKLYKVPRPDIFTRGVPAQLPEAYKRFYEEWNGPRSPVHYRPESGKWKRDPLTGVVTPIQDVPIAVKYPKESHNGIWGGEGVILGYCPPKGKYEQRTTRWWMPNLHKSVVYSEILNKRLLVIMTKRAINLIIDHHGFDNYILETRASDLQSLLALKLKKMMLLALFDKTLYPEDPSKQEEVYNKYKHYLAKYNKEDLEWYALSIGEAVAKFQAIEDAYEPKPLKHQFRDELITELKALIENEQSQKTLNESYDSKSWLSKINPFGKKT